MQDKVEVPRALGLRSLFRFISFIDLIQAWWHIYVIKLVIVVLLLLCLHFQLLFKSIQLFYLLQLQNFLLIFQLLFTSLDSFLLQLGSLLCHSLDLSIPFLFFAFLGFVSGFYLSNSLELKLGALVDHLFKFCVVLFLCKLILVVDFLPDLLDFVMHFLLVFCHFVLIEKEGRWFGLDVEIIADVILCWAKWVIALHYYRLVLL